MATDISDRMPKVPTVAEREAYEKKVKAELDRINARLAEFRAKADQAKAEAQISYHDTMEQLTAKRDALQHKWEELSRSSESAWQDVQKGLESAWNELTKSFESAAKHFDQ